MALKSEANCEMITRKSGTIITGVLLTLILVPLAESADEEVDRFVLGIQGLV